MQQLVRREYLDGIDMKVILLLAAACSLVGSTRAQDADEQYLTIPENFLLGVASAAYQVEGGWNASDKGVNIWDQWTHQTPSPVFDGSTGDVACDTYNKYREDLEHLKDLGANHYRLSLSWARILPNGFANEVSKTGLQYYMNLLDGLRGAGIEPMVTIYHWDHPQVLEDLGGWANDLMVTWFADYARIVFRELGSRVKIWITVNEPSVYCNGAYQYGGRAPGKKIPDIGPYTCVHNIIKGHARAWHIYDDEFRSSQEGTIGLAYPCPSQYPIHDNDTEAVEIFYQFQCGWMGHPIFSEEGDYPAVMKERIAENSRLAGYPRSRLPEFTQEEIEYIRGSADFLGLNHYTSVMVKAVPRAQNAPWFQDTGVAPSFNDSWPTTASVWLRVVPKGLGDLLRKLKDDYNNVPIYITENGYSDNGTTIVDNERIEYIHDYMRSMLIAVNRDGCNVKGYTAWSFLDNFEWDRGYSERFGIVHIDFTSPDRTRTPKRSYDYYKAVIGNRTLIPSAGFTASADP